MKKILAIMLVIGLVLSGCSEAVPDSDGMATTKESEEKTMADKTKEKEVVTTEKAQETTAKAQVAMAKDFSSFEAVTAYFGDMYDYFDDATEDADDMAILGDGIFIGMTGLKLSSVEMDYAMHMTEDSWEDLDDEMPNGRGSSDSILSREGDLYVYDYTNKWDDGYTDEILMHYDPALRTVDYYGDNNNPNNPSDRHIQILIDDQERLFVTIADFSANNGETDLMAIYCDGQALNYGRVKVKGDVRQEMSMDLLETAPTGWEELSTFGIFDTILTYDGSELLYTHP